MTRSPDFPRLKRMGLQACHIRGDGNCLFRALSDQYFGDQSKHLEIREVTVRYMREHPDMFKPFLAVGPYRRRAPKRKNAGSLSSRFDTRTPTDEERDAAFDNHCTEMAKPRTWGDHTEIMAFSCAYKTLVIVYQRDGEYAVDVPSHVPLTKVAHIGYHEWEHYSTIRNIKGPLTGPPDISRSSTCIVQTDAVLAKAEPVADVSPQGTDKTETTSALGQTDDGVDSAAGTPDQTDGDAEPAVGRLDKTNGDEEEDVEDDSAVDTEEHVESPSLCSSPAPGSVSIERESDSEDEDIRPPTKRRNRAGRPCAGQSVQRKVIIEDSESEYEERPKRPIKRATGPRKVKKKEAALETEESSSPLLSSSDEDYDFENSQSNISLATSISIDPVQKTDDEKEPTDSVEPETNETPEIKGVSEVEESEVPEIKETTDDTETDEDNDSDDNSPSVKKIAEGDSPLSI